MLEALATGFGALLDPLNFLILFGGLVVGILFGTIPGLSGVMAVSLLVPFTYGMTPTHGLLAMAAIYCASTYGGAMTAILFRIPGSPENAATTFDGYPMTQQGRAAEALGTAIICSAIGGLASCLVLIIVAPVLAKAVLAFGDPEYFALVAFGLSVVPSLGVKSTLKGLLSALMGLFLATVGLSAMTGLPRFTFGVGYLYSGLHFIPVMIGLFAASEVFFRSEQVVSHGEETFRSKAALPNIRSLLRLRWTILRSSLIGVIIGMLPGTGTVIASILGYNEEVRWSKHPEKFGTGVIEGVAAPETANNAATGAAMIPLLTLGIPGGAITAVMLGVFEIHGLEVGPGLFANQADMVYTIFAGMVLVNLLIIAGGLVEVRTMVRVLDIPYAVLGPIILVLCAIGSYAIRSNVVDIYAMFAFGVIGYIMKRYDYSITAMVLGLILGPIAERTFLRSMLLFDNNVLTFFTRPISGVFLVLAALSFILPFLRKHPHVLRSVAEAWRGNGRGQAVTKEAESSLGP